LPDEIFPDSGAEAAVLWLFAQWRTHESPDCILRTPLQLIRYRSPHHIPQHLPSGQVYIRKARALLPWSSEPFFPLPRHAKMIHRTSLEQDVFFAHFHCIITGYTGPLLLYFLPLCTIIRGFFLHHKKAETQQSYGFASIFLLLSSIQFAGHPPLRKPAKMFWKNAGSHRERALWFPRYLLSHEYLKFLHPARQFLLPQRGRKRMKFLEKYEFFCNYFYLILFLFFLFHCKIQYLQKIIWRLSVSGHPFEIPFVLKPVKYLLRDKKDRFPYRFPPLRASVLPQKPHQTLPALFLLPVSVSLHSYRCQSGKFPPPDDQKSYVQADGKVFRLPVHKTFPAPVPVSRSRMP